MLFLNNMIQHYQFGSQLKCEKHQQQFMAICTAPECFHYRELCSNCQRQDSHHSKMHFSMTDAYLKVHQNIENIFKGLKVLRTKIIQKMQTNMNNNEGLHEVSSRLQQIKILLNDKIDKFRVRLCEIYEQNIKKKMIDLLFVVEKSYEFLEEEKTKLIKTEKIKPFLANDLSHELRYYESYFEELLEKNVRKFKAGLESDRVMKLVVAFQQNLSEIFSFEEKIEEIVKPKPHIFHSNYLSHYLLTLRNIGSPSKKQIDFIPQNYNWIGTIPSIHYSKTDNYYLFGEGKRESNRIARIGLHNKEFRLLDIKMETKRANFAVILLNDEIYIIGGENSREGCLVKCEKFIPSVGKIHIISSLNERSAQHSLCTYKNKYILKFGGTDLMQGILEIHHDQRFKALLPQIYSIQSEQWRVINLSLNKNSPQSNINFGLWPGVFDCSSANKIIVLQGDQLRGKLFRTRYDIKMPDIDKKQQEEQEDFMKELQIQIANVQLPNSSDITFHSHCYTQTESKSIRFLVQDISKKKFSIINFFI